jgi:hydrogenase assembly chaperone HypC/HupF
MCLAYPVQVVAVEDQIAIVQVQGRLSRVVLLALQADLPVPGDWLLVQSGLAVSKLDEDDAVQRIQLQRLAQGGPL